LDGDREILSQVWIRKNLVLAARASAGARSIGVVAARDVEDVGEERLRKGCKSVLSLC
jgi:hypothetical protein